MTVRQNYVVIIENIKDLDAPILSTMIEAPSLLAARNQVEDSYPGIFDGHKTYRAIVKSTTAIWLENTPHYSR